MNVRETSLFFSINFLYILPLLLKIEYLYGNIQYTTITSYKEEWIFLSKDIPSKFYFYTNNKYEEDNNYDIIFQILNLVDKKYKCYIYIYARNEIVSNLDELLKYNLTTFELIDYDNKINLYDINEDYAEFSINDFSNESYKYFYLLFMNYEEEDNSNFNFMLFNTLEENELIPNVNLFKYYFRYKNNYKTSDFVIKLILKEHLYEQFNFQILSYKDDVFFNLSVYDNNIEQNYSYDLINSFDNNFILGNTEILYIKISFINSTKKINDEKMFAIFLDFSTQTGGGQFQNISDKSIYFSCLSKKEYYFYTILEDNYIERKQNLLMALKIFLEYGDIIYDENYIKFQYLIYNMSNVPIKERDIIINDELLSEIILINKDKFLNLNYFLDDQRLIHYYQDFLDIEDLSNHIIIFRIFINDNSIINKLKMKTFEVRRIPMKILSEDMYNETNYFIEYYTSKYVLEQLGYYYIPINNLSNKNFVYCPFSSTMNIYLNEFDISKSIIYPLLENQILYIINPNDLKNIKGITIITYNEIGHYFFQFGEIKDDLLNKLKINNFNDDINMNQEIKFNNSMDELYLINLYSFYDDFILSVETLFGDVSIDYLSLSKLFDWYKTFNNIFPFNDELLKYYTQKINNPILTDSSNIEIIRIKNNLYSNGSISFENNLIYINRYKIYSEIDENEFMPIFISDMDNFINYPINLNSKFGDINYTFMLCTENLQSISDDQDIIITINDIQLFLSNKDTIKKGKISASSIDHIQIKNNFQKNIIIWVLISRSNADDYEVFYASEKSFDGIMTTGKIYLFVFDYINIISKRDKGLYPYKFIFNLEKLKSNVCNGYYYQTIDDKNFFIFRPSNINSIYYEMTNNENNIYMNNVIFSPKSYIDNDTFCLNTLIQQNNGYLKVHFYVEYFFDLGYKENKLSLFNFDESIYSVNYKLSEGEDKKYLIFQVLTCEQDKDFNIQFFIDNPNFPKYFPEQEDDNIKIDKISEDNYFGYINLEESNNTEKTSNILYVKRPGKLYINYFYTYSKIEGSFDNLMQALRKTQYNIYIEKVKTIEDKDIFSVSFDCLLTDSITNYFIITLEEGANDIINECQFLSFYDNFERELNNVSSSINFEKYISFIEEGNNNRIYREITFDNYGLYKIYVLALELEKYSLYKLLGVKTYNHIYQGPVPPEKKDEDYSDKTKTEKKDNNNISITLIIIFIIILIIIIIFLIAWLIYNYKKRKNEELLNLLQVSNRDEGENDYKNLKEQLMINDNQIISENEKVDDDFSIFSQEIEEEGDKEKGKINIKIEEEKNIDDYLESSKGNNIIDDGSNNDEGDYIDEKNEPPPPPITTQPSDDIIIANIMNDMKKNLNNDSIGDDEKMYTNDGKTLTPKGD